MFDGDGMLYQSPKSVNWGGRRRTNVGALDGREPGRVGSTGQSSWGDYSLRPPNVYTMLAAVRTLFWPSFARFALKNVVRR